MSKQSLNNNNQEDWQRWFGSESGFENWKNLSTRVESLQQLVSGKTKLNLTSVQENLETAREKLRFDEPYRVVVIGETGAGKSTLINALLKQKLLPSESGATVTGTATRIYPNVNLEEELEKQLEARNDIGQYEPSELLKGFVRIKWRDDRDFRELLESYGLELSDSFLESTKNLEDLDIEKLVSKLDDEKKEQSTKEIKDIIATWNRLNGT